MTSPPAINAAPSAKAPRTRKRGDKSPFSIPYCTINSPPSISESAAMARVQFWLSHAIRRLATAALNT